MTCKLILENQLDKASISSPQIKPNSNINNLKNNFKTSTALFTMQGGLDGYVDIVLSWTKEAQVGAVVIPASSLSSSSTIEIINIQGYTNQPEKPILAGTNLANWDFSQNLNETQGTCIELINSTALRDTPAVAVYYLTENISTTGLTIRIRDPQATEIAVSRIVVGTCVNFQINADYSSSVSYEDSGQHVRTASGDLRTSDGVKQKTMQISMGWLIPADREKVLKLFKQGVNKFLFVSLLPEYYDPSMERQYSIYGKLDNLGNFGISASTVQDTAYKVLGY